MSQIRELSANPNNFSSYPLTRNLDPYGSYPLTGNLNPVGSYPLTRNLDPYGSQISEFSSYPLTRNLEPYGDAGSFGSLLGGAGSLLGGVASLFNGGGGGSKATGPTIVNVEPAAQPAPPTPFNWTPVIISGGVVLVALTLIMTSTRRK